MIRILYLSSSRDTRCFYKPEPDIEFQKDGRVVATIEIKGGRDKAGGLERLGAMTKSFENTPPGCVNMLIAGVVTEEMQNRLQKYRCCESVPA